LKRSGKKKSSGNTHYYYYMNSPLTCKLHVDTWPGENSVIVMHITITFKLRHPFSKVGNQWCDKLPILARGSYLYKLTRMYNYVLKAKHYPWS